MQPQVYYVDSILVCQIGKAKRSSEEGLLKPMLLFFCLQLLCKVNHGVTLRGHYCIPLSASNFSSRGHRKGLEGTGG